MFLVLKILRKGQVASFLTANDERIVARFQSRGFHTLSPGCFFTAQLEQSGEQLPRLKEVRLHQVVLWRCVGAHRFFSLVLDIVHSFSPQWSRCPQLFSLMHTTGAGSFVNLFTTEKAVRSLLCGLVVRQLGFFSSSLSINDLLDHFLHYIQTDHGVRGAILLNHLLLRYALIREDLHSWIVSCLQQHPQFDNVKHFWLEVMHYDA